MPTETTSVVTGLFKALVVAKMLDTPAVASPHGHAPHGHHMATLYFDPLDITVSAHALSSVVQRDFAQARMPSPVRRQHVVLSVHI